MKEAIKCTLCGAETDDYCNDLVCRDCHKTESFEDCVNNVQINRILRDWSG